MKAFTNHLRNYLELRRGLGFELGRVESRLRNFIAFMETKRARQITTALALEFALRADHRSAATQAGCLSAIRGFTHYLSGIEVTTEIPPTGLIRRGHRPQPYIYSDDEITRILDAARRHPSISRYALKPYTLHCLLGLLSVTGMRLTEALNLKPEDIDWQQGVLTIGRAKFQKSRLVPLHKSTLSQLRVYKKRRDCFFALQPWRQPVNRIFVSSYGGPLTSSQVGYNFRMLTRRIGIRKLGARNGPRIHDLRHRFAVSTLLRWYRNGKNVELLLPVLSTYLGHVFITGTYWYLTCTPQLMEAAGKRLENRWKGVGHAQG
jgi:integrase